jgi:hypothetical protein
MTMHQPDEPTWRAAFDIEMEVGARLLTTIDSFPADQKKRFRKAAQKAANSLEARTPAVTGLTANGIVAGLYATDVSPGCMSIVFADASRAVGIELPLSAIDDVLAESDAGAQELEPEDRSGALPALANHVLKKRKINDAMLGLFLTPPHVECARGLAQAGVVPALVVLLATDRKGVVRFVLPQGRTWPELGAMEPEGSA